MRIILNIIMAFMLVFIGYCFGQHAGYEPSEDVKHLREANEFKRDMIDAYEHYYVCTENLLDTLNKYDNWVDRFDPMDYYDDRHSLDMFYVCEL